MTSKYNHKIDISRFITIDELKNILQQLKNDIFLEFSKVTSDHLGRVFLGIVAYGYISNQKKYIKLTNIQRRKLIGEINHILLIITTKSGTQDFSIHLAGTDYINSLPIDDWT
ncbi:MAG: hypothetical protein WD512_08015 [Candidatus Paceibacterota bacterium]